MRDKKKRSANQTALTAHHEWTDRTWNPIRGCSRVSPGCKKCYAERLAARNLPGMKSPTTGQPFAIMKNGEPHWTGKVELIESKLTDPLHWRKPCRCFVNSMSDLFHEALSDEAIERIFAVMASTPHITYQVLTKRRRMLEWFQKRFGAGHRGDRINEQMARWIQFPRDFPHGRSFQRYCNPWPLPNVWLGVSVEDQARKDRIEVLRQTPAAVRFLSLEPLLEDIGELDLRGIHQVIIGGESGPGARPFDIKWARSPIRQSRAAGVAVFMTQLGADPYRVDEHSFISSARNIYLKLADRKGADMAEWPEWMRIREYPQSLSDSTSTARPR